MTSRSWRAVVVAGALLAATGCTANVGTGFTVTGKGSATVKVAAVFTDEAAEVVATDTASRNGLVDLFTARLGVRPDVDVDDKIVTAVAEVDYTDLAEVADVTGVQSAALSEDGHRFEVTFAAPKALQDAVVDQVAGEPDAAALAATMLESTNVVVSVTYPGGIDAAKVTYSGRRAGPEPTVTGDTVTWAQNAQHATAGTLVVTGDPTDRTSWWIGLGALAVLVGALGWYRRR